MTPVGALLSITNNSQTNVIELKENSILSKLLNREAEAVERLRESPLHKVLENVTTR